MKKSLLSIVAALLFSFAISVDFKQSSNILVVAIVEDHVLLADGGV